MQQRIQSGSITDVCPALTIVSGLVGNTWSHAKNDALAVIAMLRASSTSKS